VPDHPGAEHEDPGLGVRLAQLQRLVDVRHPEPARPGPECDAGYPRHPVPVGVGLDHRQEMDAAPELGAYPGDVVPDRAQVDLGPRLVEFFHPGSALAA